MFRSSLICRWKPRSGEFPFTALLLRGCGISWLSLLLSNGSRLICSHRDERAKRTQIIIWQSFCGMWNRYFSTKVDIDLRYWCKRINCGRRCWYSIPSSTFFPCSFFFRIYLRSLPFERMPFTLMMCLLLSPLSGFRRGRACPFLSHCFGRSGKQNYNLNWAHFYTFHLFSPLRTFRIGNQRSCVFVRSPFAVCRWALQYFQKLYEMTSWEKKQLRIRGIVFRRRRCQKKRTDFLFRSSSDPILFAIRQSNNVDYSNVANGQYNFCVAIFCNLCNAIRSSFFIRSICRSLQLFYLAAFQNFALKFYGFACVWKIVSVNVLKWR